MSLYDKEKEYIKRDYESAMLSINIIPVISFILTLNIYIYRDYLLDYYKYIIGFLLFFVVISLWFTFKEIDIIFARPMYKFVYKNPEYYYTDFYKVIYSNFLNKSIIIFISMLFIFNLFLKEYSNHSFIISILISIFIFLIYFKYKKKNYDRQAKKRKIKDKENFNNKKEYKFEKKVNDNRLLLECYKNLGFKVVPVSFEQVKNQYMNLVKENHPDRGGDIETMQKINEAYEEAKSKFGK